MGQRLNIVEQLLDRGVSPDTGLEKGALVEEVKAKDLKILEILLDFGADPNFALAGGITPLRTASELNREGEADLLLQWGAGPSVSAPDRAPLAYAIYHKNLVLVISLLKYGADPALKMKNGENALVYASDRECPLNCGSNVPP